ncbi:O-unit flippase-like protein [Vibrio campbellii]|uniref:O-unit flippase-like protein n=1 Tax=Vibrio campbellii TaxID=680 RepID=UPI004055E1D4
MKNRQFIWAYLAQFLKIGSGVLLLPVALTYLSAEEMGYWYIFLAMTSLVQLLEVGCQPTISRLTAYVLSGATSIRKDGVPNISVNVKPELLTAMIVSSRSIYIKISLFVSLAFIGPGTYYLMSFDSFNKDIMIAWAVYVLATIIDFYFSYYSGLIIGKGKQTEVFKAVAISKAVVLFCSIPLLYYEFGLLALSIGSLLSTFIARYLLRRVFLSNFSADLKLNKEQETTREEAYSAIYENSKKLSVTGLGNFLILRSGAFFASSFVGLEAAASYGLTMQLVGIVSSLSTLIFTLEVPKLNQLQVKKEFIKIKALFKNRIVSANLIYIVGCAGIWFCSEFIFPYFEFNTELLSLNCLIVLCIVQLLDLNHSICATYLTTLNQVPFMVSSVISGIGVIILSYLLVIDFGILGIILSRGIVQALYNNWKWPLSVYYNFKVQ